VPHDSLAERAPASPLRPQWEQARGPRKGTRQVYERYMKGQCALVPQFRRYRMCAVAAICGFTKIRATRSCPRTTSAPIGAISARGGRRPRTHGGQRRHASNHNRAFLQVRGIFGHNSVNTVKPSAQPCAAAGPQGQLNPSELEWLRAGMGVLRASSLSSTLPCLASRIGREDRSGLVLRLTQCYWRSTSATRTLLPVWRVLR
jgi:hypothetical protein